MKKTLFAQRYMAVKRKIEKVPYSSCSIVIRVVTVVYAPVTRPCNVYWHVTAPYKSSFYYYYTPWADKKSQRYSTHNFVNLLADFRKSFTITISRKFAI